VIEFIKLLPEKGGNKKPGKEPGSATAVGPDGAVCITVNASSESLPDVGRLQISRLIGS
jgi:hypothetical protein